MSEEAGARSSALRSRLRRRNEAPGGADAPGTNDAPLNVSDAQGGAAGRDENSSSSGNVAPGKGRLGAEVQMKGMGESKSTNNNSPSGNDVDLEAGVPPSKDAGEKQRLLPGPLTVMEPLQRQDPVAQLRVRQRRLERAAVDRVPEIHFLGQLVSAKGIIQDGTEGCTIRWKIHHGPGWQTLGGETSGQTQVSYCRSHFSNPVPLNHPVDVHVAELGLQTSPSPSILFQAFRLDWHGRLILAGYGFAPLPNTPGHHAVEANLWIPVGSPAQELDSYFLGRSPALVEEGPVFEAAWKERCRLMTAPAGQVTLELFVLMRNADVSFNAQDGGGL